MTRLRALTGVVACSSLSWASPAAADSIRDWNETMLRAGLVASMSPQNMSRAAAIVQVAVFDAVNGVDRRYTPVHADPPASCAGASREAAAAQAAYVALSKLYGAGGVFTPNQQVTFDARRTVSLATIAARESAASISRGITCGQAVAEVIWEWRLTDGFSLAPPTFAGSATAGQWRQTPNAPYPGLSSPMAGYPQYVTMVPWALQSPSQFRPAGPPALDSDQYARDFKEVKTLGSQTSAARTPDQTIYAWFWASATPMFLWNTVALSLIDDRSREDGDAPDRGDDRQRDGGGTDRRHRTLLHNARMLALLNVAMADALIGCWDAKYAFNFWRPITAIREADPSNSKIRGDAGWTPLFATPPHPDYPSGHSCISSAATTVLSDEFGARTRFSMTSDGLLGVSRSFRSFPAALEEVKNARIVAGIHFRTACDDGTVLGSAVARHVLATQAQRVR